MFTTITMKTSSLIWAAMLLSVLFAAGCILDPPINGKVDSAPTSVVFPDATQITVSLQNSGGSFPDFLYKEGKNIGLEADSNAFDVLEITPRTMDLLKGKPSKQVNISLKTSSSASAGLGTINVYYKFEGKKKLLASKQIMISKPKVSLIVPPSMNTRSEQKIDVSITVKNDERLSQSELSLLVDTTLEHEKDDFKLSSGISDTIKGTPRYENSTWIVDLANIQPGEAKVILEMEVKSPVKDRDIPFKITWSLLRKGISLTSAEQTITILPR